MKQKNQKNVDLCYSTPYALYVWRVVVSAQPEISLCVLALFLSQSDNNLEGR